MTQKEKVLQQKINAMSVICVGDKKHTAETIVRAFKYFALSREAYNCLREDFELPSARHSSHPKLKQLMTAHM